MTTKAEFMPLTVAASGSLEAYTHAVSTIPMLTADRNAAWLSVYSKVAILPPPGS
jgi:hypothetical protein